MQRLGVFLLAVLVLGGVGWGWSNYNQRVESATDRRNPISSPSSVAATPDPATEPLLSALPGAPRALFLGDSYTQGAGAASPETTWAQVAAQQLGWTGVFDGYGGSGFTWGGGEDGAEGQDYLARLRQVRKSSRGSFDVVVLQGGQNDHRATPAELEAATTKTVEFVEKAWPEAQVIVLGPVAPQPLGGLLNRIASPIEDAAQDAGAASINPTAEQWLTEENTPRYDFDGSHVNQAGHEYLADRFAEAVKELRVATA